MKINDQIYLLHFLHFKKLNFVFLFCRNSEKQETIYPKTNVNLSHKRVIKAR